MMPTRFSRDWWWLQLQSILPTNWRNIVQWLIVFGVLTLVNYLRGPSATPIPIPDPPLPVFDLIISDESIDANTAAELEKRNVKIRRTGWHKPVAGETEETLRLMLTPRWQDTEASDVITGPEEDAPVWRFHEKVTGQALPAHDQGQIGSCVSFGTALSIELSLAAKINGKRGPPQAYSENLREAIYGGSRINADPRNPMRGGDGSTGARAAKWLSSVGGALPVENRGPYSVARCREWGNNGVPADLVPICKKNGCQTTLINSADQGRQALQQGYAIFVCSDVGFGQSGPYTRDRDGFLKASGSWPHCMCIAGYQGGSRKGFLIVNSWGGNWVQGPTGKFTDIPAGSFWADYSTVDRMLKQGDSYAVADVDGFKRRKLEPSDWIVNRPRERFDVLFAIGP